MLWNSCDTLGDLDFFLHRFHSLSAQLWYYCGLLTYLYTPCGFFRLFGSSRTQRSWNQVLITAPILARSRIRKFYSIYTLAAFRESSFNFARILDTLKRSFLGSNQGRFHCSCSANLWKINPSLRMYKILIFSSGFFLKSVPIFRCTQFYIKWPLVVYDWNSMFFPVLTVPSTSVCILKPS